MINPSAAGWIDKYFLKANPSGFEVSSPETYYLKVRDTGFIYGHVVSLNGILVNSGLGWTRDEISKVALLESLYGLYVSVIGKKDPQDFISKAIDFYKSMGSQGFSLFRNMFGSKPSSTLEEIIDDRVQTNHDIISRNFSHIVTNALLFIDVLAFQHFLEKERDPRGYLQKMEEIINSVVSLALKAKVAYSDHDEMLIRLFEASVRYGKFSGKSSQSLDNLDFSSFQLPLEKFYLIDIAGLVLWRDQEISNDEVYFLQKLAELLNLNDEFVSKSIRDTDDFIQRHYDEIPYFNYSHPVKHFYDNLTQTVILLIKRNTKRLTKEISQNKELMMLLAKSATRDLNAVEKKKVKSQLLEICKTVPALSIFLLPGGSLLLPILIKFIPQLLPAAFNENIQEE